MYRSFVISLMIQTSRVFRSGNSVACCRRSATNCDPRSLFPGHAGSPPRYISGHRHYVLSQRNYRAVITPVANLIKDHPRTLIHVMRVSVGTPRRLHIRRVPSLFRQPCSATNRQVFTKGVSENNRGNRPFPSFSPARDDEWTIFSLCSFPLVNFNRTVRIFKAISWSGTERNLKLSGNFHGWTFFYSNW